MYSRLHVRLANLPQRVLKPCNAGPHFISPLCPSYLVLGASADKFGAEGFRSPR